MTTMAPQISVIFKSRALMNEEELQALNKFLEKSKHQIFHHPDYATFIEQAFSQEYYFAIAKDDSGNIVTLLPYCTIKSKIFPEKIISSAYIEYGGFAGSEKGVQKILEALSEKYSTKYDYLEIRGSPINSQHEVLKTILLESKQFKRFILPLKDKEEQDLWQGIQKSKRKAIRKATKVLEVREIEPSELDELYTLYAKNMKRFGSPAYSKQYFSAFFETLVAKNLAKVYGSYHKGTLVSALLGLTYSQSKRVHIIIAVSDPKAQELRPTDVMHWEFIKWAKQQGFEVFDFGKVREESGQFKYKAKWGPTLEDLPSYYALWKSKTIPFEDPHSTKYSLATKLWKKLPLKLTTTLGMKLRKEIGL